MKKISVLMSIVVLSALYGCAYNANMRDADIAKHEAYGKAMAAYYENVSAKIPEKVADIQLSDDGRVKAFVVYNTAVKLPDAPIAPKDTKTAATQTTEAIVNSSVVGSALNILGTGLIVKIATDNAGDRDSNNSGSNNQSSGPQSIATESASASMDTSTKDSSAHDSSTKTSNVHTEETTGSNNTDQVDVNNDKSDNSQIDVANDKSDNSDNSDNSTDNSDNSQDDVNNNKPIDNSVDNTDQNSGGVTNNTTPL